MLMCSDVQMYCHTRIAIDVEMEQRTLLLVLSICTFTSVIAAVRNVNHIYAHESYIISHTIRNITALEYPSYYLQFFFYLNRR